MGYDVHITRKTNWFDEGPEITLEEWEAYAESDPALSPEGWVGWKINEKSVRARIFTFQKNRNGDAAALCWCSGGDISAKNPSRDGVAYMVSIAARFGAKVQGDDGEFYDQQGNPIRD
jgi:hypothetical protein